MKWSLDGDTESRKALSEMYYLRKSWGTGRIWKIDERRDGMPRGETARAEVWGKD